MRHPVEHPGLYPDLSLLYHNEQLTPTRCLTQSGIKVLINETPLDYINAAPKRTRLMDFGSVVHSMALGKLQRFVLSPHEEYRTKEARAWRDSTYANNQIPMKAEEYADASAVAEMVKSKIDTILGGAPYETEVPFFWQEGSTWCGGMLDVWCEDRLLAIDPKITAHVGQRARSNMVNQAWDMQAAWYRRGLESIFPNHSGRIRFTNLLIKPEAPFTSRVVMLNEAWRHSAEMECLRGLRIFQECMRSGKWPGYPDSIEMLDAPAWMLAQRMQAEMEEGQ